MAELKTASSYADFVRSQIGRLRAAYPEIEEDAELLAGMIEGETDFERVIDMLLEVYQDRTSLSLAASARAVELRERSARLERNAEAAKDVLRELLIAADKTMVRRPTGTLVLSKGRPKLELDGDFNAQGYMRVKSEPMKADIIAALAVGGSLPGARLVPSEPTLSVRTK